MVKGRTGKGEGEPKKKTKKRKAGGNRKLRLKPDSCGKKMQGEERKPSLRCWKGDWGKKKEWGGWGKRALVGTRGDVGKVKITRQKKLTADVLKEN